MTDYGRGIVGFVIAIISLIQGFIAFIVSCSVSIRLLYHLYGARLKRDEQITTVLSINIYLVILIFATNLISMATQGIIGDIYGSNFDSPWCTFQAYFLFLSSCNLYFCFAIQAFFRLCRIVYLNYRWLQLFWFYVISLFIQMVMGSVLLCPLLLLHYIDYLPNDYICSVYFTNVYGGICLAICCYSVPLIILSVIYFRIMLYLRQQQNNIAATIKKKQQRDLMAVKRIFINIGLLGVLGFPCTIMLLISLINGTDYPLTYRIAWITGSLSLAVISIEMIFMTPQLRGIIFKRLQQNQVSNMQVSIKMIPVKPAKEV